MTAFLSLSRGTPRVAAGLRPLPRPRRHPAVDRRDVGATALIAGAQLLLACGYALLIALVCSAVAAPTP